VSYAANDQRTAFELALSAPSVARICAVANVSIIITQAYSSTQHTHKVWSSISLYSVHETRANMLGLKRGPWATKG
jgi:hypothetical protein